MIAPLRFTLFSVFDELIYSLAEAIDERKEGFIAEGLPQYQRGMLKLSFGRIE